MFSTTTLWIPFTINGRARPGRAQCDAAELTGPLGTWGATNIRFLFGFPFSIVFFARRDRCDRRRRAMADRVVLALAVARRAQPDSRHRHDAAGDERPLVRGDDGLSQDRGDPDRDLRLCVSRRSPDLVQGDRDPDRDRRRRHRRASARRREGLWRSEADIARARRSRGVCAVGGWLSWRGHRCARRVVRDGGVLHAGVRIVRADAGADDLSAGARARGARGRSSGCGNRRCSPASWARSPRSSGFWHSR